MQRLDAQRRNQNQAVHPGETCAGAENRRRQPSIAPRRQERADNQGHEETLGVPDMQKIGGWKNEHEPHRAVGDRLRIIDRNQPRERDRGADRGEKRHDKGADQRVADEQNRNPHQPGIERIEYDRPSQVAGLLVAVYGDIEVLAGVPPVPDVEHLIEAEDAPARGDLKRKAAENEREQLGEYREAGRVPIDAAANRRAGLALRRWRRRRWHWRDAAQRRVLRWRVDFYGPVVHWRPSPKRLLQPGDSRIAAKLCAEAGAASCRPGPGPTSQSH